LEPRLIYSATDSLKSKLHWKKKINEEWIHFGTGNDIDYDLVNKSITEHLNGEDIYLVFERTNSGYFKEEQFQKLFKSILGKKNFYLWNKKLTKAIEFNYVGILRVGNL
jgi:predicted acylesterase/phospholipase RssA